jgi:hypothetical protein
MFPSRHNLADREHFAEYFFMDKDKREREV